MTTKAKRHIERPILGESKPVRQMVALIEKVAVSKTSILIVGESGTGKELVARMIHEFGPLGDGPFVPVNCGAIPENLIESELFGHKRGSFTGAVGDKQGLFEVANGGTIFLDEIGELPLSMQVKLLRALQERSFKKVGAVEDVKVDVRVIAATNRDLETAIRQGTFREDLYYRLNVIMIKTPPLRDRVSDIPLLAQHFLEKHAKKHGKEQIGMSDDVMEVLCAYAWPGNVRELENTLERAVALETSQHISLQVLPPQLAERVALTQPVVSSPMIAVPAPDFTQGRVDLDSILGALEKGYLEAALLQSQGVKKKAADLLGITFRSFRYRLKKAGLSSDDPDSDDEA